MGLDRAKSPEGDLNFEERWLRCDDDVVDMLNRDEGKAKEGMWR